MTRKKVLEAVKVYMMNEPEFNKKAQLIHDILLMFTIMEVNDGVATIDSLVDAKDFYDKFIPILINDMGKWYQEHMPGGVKDA